MVMPKKILNYVFSVLFLSLIIYSLIGVLNTEIREPYRDVNASGLNFSYLPTIKKDFPVKTLFGVEMNPITDAQGLQKMSVAGASWVRRNSILWSEIEPIQGGGYDWSSLASLEADFLRAHTNNMEVIMIVRGIPEWARMPPYNYACGPINPAAFPAFGNFMYAVVQRYSNSPYYVKYWEIWNEPDVDPSSLPNGDTPYGCLGNIGDTSYFGGQDYATVLQFVYPMIKAANPDAKVVVGGLLLNCDPLTNPEGCIPSKYLEGILVAGGKDYFDGVAFHAYDYFSIGDENYPNGIYGSPGWQSGGYQNTLYGALKPVLVAKAQYIKSLFAQYNVQDKFLMNTETALLCGDSFDPPGGTGCEATENSPFEQLKATYVAQTYAAGISEGLVANIWYTAKGWRNSGLLFDDLSHRPAYEAYKLAHTILEKAVFVREIHEYEGSMVFGYEFQVQQKLLWVLWTLDGNPHTINLLQTPASVRDEVGDSVTFTPSTLSLQGLKTYYINWNP